MALNKKDILKKVGGAMVSGGGNYIRDGRGRLAIKKLDLKDGFNGASFLAEFIVVSSSKIPVTELKTGKQLDVTPNEVGSECSWVQMLDKHLSAFGNVKGFMLELFGEPEATEQEIADTLEKVTGSCDDPDKNVDVMGRVIDFETYRKVTKENAMEIVIPKWSYVEQAPEDVARMRAWMVSLFTGQKAQAATVNAPV